MRNEAGQWKNHSVKRARKGNGFIFNAWVTISPVYLDWKSVNLWATSPTTTIKFLSFPAAPPRQRRLTPLVRSLYSSCLPSLNNFNTNYSIIPIAKEDSEAIINIFNHYAEHYFAASPENKFPLQAFKPFL